MNSFIHFFIVGLFILQILHRFIQLDRKQQQQPQINSCVEYLPYFLRDYIVLLVLVYICKQKLFTSGCNRFYHLSILSEYIRRECKTKGDRIQVCIGFSHLQKYILVSLSSMFVYTFLGGKLGVSISDAALFLSHSRHYPDY